MLTLSLSRSFSLHFFILRKYAPRKAGKPAPRLNQHPFRKDDLLEECRALKASGYTAAAAMTARAEIERLLTTLVLKQHDFGNQWLGTHQTATWLHKNHLLRTNAYKLVVEAAAIGNRAAHGGEVSLEQVNTMFVAIDTLRHAQRRQGINGWRKGGAA